MHLTFSVSLRQQVVPVGIGSRETRHGEGRHIALRQVVRRWRVHLRWMRRSPVWRQDQVQQRHRMAFFLRHFAVGETDHPTAILPWGLWCSWVPLQELWWYALMRRYLECQIGIDMGCWCGIHICSDSLRWNLLLYTKDEKPLFQVLQSWYDLPICWQRTSWWSLHHPPCQWTDRTWWWIGDSKETPGMNWLRFNFWHVMNHFGWNQASAADLDTLRCVFHDKGMHDMSSPFGTWLFPWSSVKPFVIAL